MEKIKTIFFSGGGTRGIAFIGAVKALQEHNMLNNCETIIGTSIGSMVACGLSLGVSSSIMNKVWFDFDVSKCSNISIEHLLTDFGLDDGKKFMQPFIQAFETKANRNLTFKKHYELTKKRLIITVACVNDQKTKYFDYKKTPNTSVIRAIRMSISVPFFFTSQKFCKKHMVDGGTFECYPFKLFGNPKTFLGLNISKSEKQQIKTINSIETFITQIIYGSRKRTQYLERLLCKDYNMIDIPIDAPFIDFQNSKKIKRNMFQSGYDSTKNYILEYMSNNCENPKKLENSNNLENMDKHLNNNNFDIIINNQKRIENKLDMLLKLCSPKILDVATLVDETFNTCSINNSNTTDNNENKQSDDNPPLENSIN
jgi:NTE family protein